MRKAMLLPLALAVLCFGFSYLICLEIEIEAAGIGVYNRILHYDDPEELYPTAEYALNAALVRLTAAEKDAVGQLDNRLSRKWAVINTINRRHSGMISQQDWLDFCYQGKLPEDVPDWYVEPEDAKLHRAEEKQKAATILADFHRQALRARYASVALLLLGGFFLYRGYKAGHLK